MLQIPAKIKPTRGFSHSIHLGYKILLPILAYILVRTDFVPLAILLVLVSKWRMFAVQPRFWLTHIIFNSIDIMFSIAIVLFMANTTVVWWQLFWTILFGGWLIWLKPKSDVLGVSAQAMVGQLFGLSALYLKFGDAPLFLLVLATWAITYASARHFLTSFEEPHSALIAHLWAYFSAGLAFVLGHWLLYYGSVAQIIVILTTIGYSLAALYYLDANDRLTPGLQKQLMGIMFAILLITIVLSDWTGATV